MAIGGGFLSDLGRRSEAARAVAEDIGRRVAEGYRERREGAADVRGELTRLWRQVEALVENRAAPAAADLARTAGSYAGEGRDLAIEAAERLRAATRARPLLAIGIAVAASFAIATLLGSGRRRDH